MLVWNEVILQHWKYAVADWVVEPGIPDHHLRIVGQFVDSASIRWYRIFDTSMTEVHSDYKLRRADDLEPKSRLEARPLPADVAAILQRTEHCRFVRYSIFARTDCESLQRWIHSGNESARWSPQVWTALGTVCCLALAYVPPRSQRSRQPRRRY